jgi:hypothetical protein
LDILNASKQRVQAVVDEIKRLQESEFPYLHSRQALDQLGSQFDGELARLKSFDAQTDPEVVIEECKATVGYLFDYLPLLGFLLRSTNVRNAFEVFRPLLGLAKMLLKPFTSGSGQETRLVLSSEWSYSPFLSKASVLEDFVLIGFPAPESGNPLLVPLAGHEFGHVLWTMAQVEKLLEKNRLDDSIVSWIQAAWDDYSKLLNVTHLTPEEYPNDLQKYEDLAVALPWARAQAEEVFADFVGIRVFGESFFKAFAYLLAPGLPCQRSLTYPTMEQRVAYQIKAANHFEIHAPDKYAESFHNEEVPKLKKLEEFYLKAADQAVNEAVGRLIAVAGDLVNQSGIPVPANCDEELRIWKRFHHVVPAEKCLSIVDILNAAWRSADDPLLWKRWPELVERRSKILKELVLKNIEVFDAERIPEGDR